MPTGWCLRTERDHAREQGHQVHGVKARPRRRLTRRRSWRCLQLYAEEKIRGAKKCYSAGVAEGEALHDHGQRGTMRHSDGLLAYAQGWGGLYIAPTSSLEDGRPHPELA